MDAGPEPAAASTNLRFVRVWPDPETPRNRELMSLSEIRSRMSRAEADAGREPGSTRLIAVTKMQPEERIRAALDQGQLTFGENRVQEAAARWPQLRERHPGIELHLLGPLQSNKARQAIRLFDAIHSVDRIRIAERIAGLAQEAGECPELFVQVNTGEEPQKSGIPPAETDGFVKRARDLDLPVRGLMCIPPQEDEPALHFALLVKIATRNGLEGLSMGMSADFETAIRLGATHIRVGTAVFGQRPHGR